MDVTNKTCEMGIQNNINTSITNNITVHSTSSSGYDEKNQDFHLLKTVKSFHGRDDELEQLSSWLFQEKKKSAVICGLPGYGKTELARRFAHHCKGHELVHSVLWLDAESGEVLEQSLRELLRWLGASDKAALDVRSVVQAVHQHFSTQRHLFVLDNALDRRNVLGFEPEGECCCIFTSHLGDWGDDVPSLQLMPLSLHFAVDVLRTELKHRFHDEDLEQYKHLAELLSCVPLALQVAAAYVRQEFKDLVSDFRLSDYVDRLQIPSITGQPLPDSSANSYDKTFRQAIQISLLKILNDTNYNSELVTDILFICACLNPEQIFYSTLLEVPYIKKMLVNCHDAKRLLKKMCALLCKYSFISVENEKISIHRLIQQILGQISNNKHYFSCMELLIVNSKYAQFHARFILKYAEYRLKIFDEFYTKHKIEIFTNDNFFWHIIDSNCKIFLIKILDALGDGAADAINTRYLLHCAVLCQQHDILELLLERYKPNVDKRAGNNDTALMLSAWKLDLCAMKILVLHKANVNAVAADGNSVLHEVIYASRLAQNFGRSMEAVESVRWLVKRGARTDAVGRRGMSLVHTASLALSPDLVRCLVQDFGCDVNAVDINQRTPLFYVAGSLDVDRGRQQDTVRCLLELGARRDVKDAVDRTPTEDAKNAGQDDLADYIDNPSAIIQKSEPIVYELRGAVARGDFAELNRLLEELGERALQVSNESCLLYEAVLYNEYHMLEMLLARGVDVDCRTTENYSPLHRAAWTLDMRAMHQLVDHGADVNAVDATGRSVLHDLIRGAGEVRRTDLGAEACEALRWLVEFGAHIDTVTSHGHSLLHAASEALSPELVRCLVTEYSLDVNAVDESSCTPLFWVSAGLRFWRAEESQGLRTAACLLELGADTHVLNAWNYTPADVARANGHKQLAALLDIATATTVEDMKLKVQGSERDEPKPVEDDVQVQFRAVVSATATATAAVAAFCTWKFLRH